VLPAWPPSMPYQSLEQVGKVIFCMSRWFMIAETSFQMGSSSPMPRTCPGSGFGIRTSVLAHARVGTTPVWKACCTNCMVSSHGFGLVSRSAYHRLISSTDIVLAPGAHPLRNVFMAMMILSSAGISSGILNVTSPQTGSSGGICSV